MSTYFHPQDFNDSSQYFGFFGKFVNSKNPVDFEGEITFGCAHYISSKRWNLLVALNMIPIIGNIIAGIMHIRMAYGEEGDLENDRLLARGIAELTIIGGIALAIGDIVVTVGRMCTPEPSDDSSESDTDSESEDKTATCC